MNKLIKLLQTPYPALCKRWKTVVVPSLIVFLIIYLLQPFGISRMAPVKLPVLLGYAVVSSAALSIMVYLLPWLFPAYHKEQNWTVGKELLHTLIVCLLIGLFNWLYTAWAFGLSPDWRLLGICMIWVVLLAPFPIVFFIMWNRNLVLARNLREATELNACLKHTGRSVAVAEKRDAAAGSSHLVFAGATKEVLEMEAADFLYAEAEGNYVKITFRPAGQDNAPASEGADKEVRKTLRITMKQMEQAVEGCPFIVRCHRAFLVNVGRVTDVSGNSQGYRLRLEGCRDEVPVSRAYAKQVRTMIEKGMNA